MVKRLFQFPRERQRVDHGIEPEVAVAAKARCGDVIRRAHSDEESRGGVYCALNRLVIPTRTELANHGPALPRATAPSRRRRAIRVPWRSFVPSSLSIATTDTAADGVHQPLWQKTHKCGDRAVHPPV